MPYPTSKPVDPSRTDLDHTRRQFQLALEQIRAHQPAVVLHDGPRRLFRTATPAPDRRRVQS